MQWIYGDDLRSVLFGFFQRGHHPRVIGAWVLPHNNNNIGIVKIIEGDSPFTYTYHICQTNTG